MTFTIKLEQALWSPTFGEVLVSIQYDGSGPKLVTISSQKFGPDIRHFLDRILGLVNYTLSKNLPVAEVSEQLSARPEDGNYMALDEIFDYLAQILKLAPEQVQHIKPEDLQPINFEMYKLSRQLDNAGGLD